MPSHRRPSSLCAELEQAKDDVGTDCKTVRGSPLPGLVLPQCFDGVPIQFAGIIELAGEDLDAANGYGFARVAFDVLGDSVVAGAFLLRIGDGRCANAAPARAGVAAALAPAAATLSADAGSAT
jgi:hypothetical protein